MCGFYLKIIKNSGNQAVFRNKKLRINIKV